MGLHRGVFSRNRIGTTGSTCTTCGSEPASDTIPRVRHSRLRLERMDSSPIRAGDSSLRQPPLKKALGHAAEWMALLAIPPVTWTLGTVGDHTWMTNSAL